jgi:hypothetical protein
VGRYQLIGSFSLLAEFFHGFFVLFFLLFDEYTGILSQFLKSWVGTLLSFEKYGDLVDVYKYTRCNAVTYMYRKTG